MFEKADSSPPPPYFSFVEKDHLWMGNGKKALVNYANLLHPVFSLKKKKILSKEPGFYIITDCGEGHS